MTQTLVSPPKTQAVQRPPSRSIPLYGDRDFRQISITWLDSGKPVLEGEGIEDVETSFSHDDEFCLCVVGQGAQGCDIAPITPRTRASWLSLLTQKQETLLDELMLLCGDSVDMGGTRIWAAMEALAKAAGSSADRSLRIDRRIGNTVLFQGISANHCLSILTFPVQFSKGSQRIIAIVVAQ